MNNCLVLDESEPPTVSQVILRNSSQPIRNQDSSPAADEKREKKLREAREPSRSFTRSALGSRMRITIFWSDEKRRENSIQSLSLEKG